MIAASQRGTDQRPAGTAHVSPREQPAETRQVHTRILRNMLAVEDSYSYWQRVDPSVPLADRARVAFEQRWFGTKSEARVRTVVSDMVERFDAFPDALALLHALGTVAAKLRPLICHLHTQLADPVYRRFSGDFLAERRAQGHTTIDRPTVARWVASLEPDRWSGATCLKFASNLLATALDAGLVSGRRDPRNVTAPVLPDAVLGYALYLLRNITIEGSLTDNAYLRSLGVTAGTFRAFAPSVPGIRYAELGGASELVFLEPSLALWGMSALGCPSS